MQISEENDVESLYSEQEQPDADTVFGIDVSESSDAGSTEGSSSDDEKGQQHFPILTFEQITKVEEQFYTETPPSPNIEVYILPTRYDVPIKVIAFFDTGAARTMMMEIDNIYH